MAVCRKTWSPAVILLERWMKSRRFSARELGSHVNLHRLYTQRARLRRACLLPLLRNFRWSVFFQLDLESTARDFAATNDPLPQLLINAHDDPMHSVHDQMFRSAVLRHRGDPAWGKFEAGAFARLREMIGNQAQLSPACPKRNVMEDQIGVGAQPGAARSGRRLD